MTAKGVATTSRQVVLKPGREKPARQRHPWIFSGAIQRVDGDVEDGEIADVVSAGGKFLARGYVNRRSQIVVRLLTWDADVPIDAAWWQSRLARAVQARAGFRGACRLVNAESDGLPGLIVDRYGRWLVAQALTLGIERVKSQLVAALSETIDLRGVYERSDVDVREKEGLAPASGVLLGEAPPDEIEIEETDRAGRGLRFLVDVRRGHKTGFYLDQADNHRRAAAYCRDADVLNLFSYTGAFGAHALARGARSVVNVDSSAEAMALAGRNFALNGFGAEQVELAQSDAFGALREFRAQGRTFDAIIVDPPKFVHRAGQVDKATRAYKDLNLVSMQILKPGGALVTFSCSGLVTPDLFQKIVFGAALDARRDAQIVEKLSQAADHPILLTFPEAEYLKGLICRVW